MKRLLSFLLVFVMIISCIGCTAEEQSETVEEIIVSIEETAEEPEIIENLIETISVLSDSFIDPVSEWSQYDELIDRINAESDPAVRTEMMHEAEDILMSTFCVIPLYYYNDAYLCKEHVTGAYADPFAIKHFMNASSENNDELKVQLSSEPAYLDPALCSSVSDASIAANSFSGLYMYDIEGKTIPACAEGYKVSDDGLTYTVALKEGLKWSDGSDLTAEDFAYSWKRAASKELNSVYSYLFSGFEGYPNDLSVTAEDELTLSFTLKYPCAYMEDLMAFHTFYPVKKDIVEINPEIGSIWSAEAGFVSNGAFVCNTWEHGTSMTYVRNPYWYDADKVTLSAITYILSDDETAIVDAYDAGEIDFVDSVPESLSLELGLSASADYYEADTLGTYYLAVNSKSELFAGIDPEDAACLRCAIASLVDRGYIVENIGQTGSTAANTFIPAGMADGNGGIFAAEEEGYFDAYRIRNDYDAVLDEARTLLKSAGFDFTERGLLAEGTPLELTCLTNKTSMHKAIAESLKQDFAVLGIKLNIVSEDAANYLYDRTKGLYDFVIEGWVADFNDPICMLEMWKTDSGNNSCRFGE